MSAVPHGPQGPDPGLYVLVALLGFQGIGADAEQLRHRLGTDKIGVGDMLRCARELGLKARSLKSRWERLSLTPSPAIAVLRDGSFLIAGQNFERGSARAGAGRTPPAVDDARRV
jgi:ATP-binding cassette, subfamily B, bacterial HlyB/CyaB